MLGSTTLAASEDAFHAATHSLEPITNSDASKGVVSSGRNFEVITDRLQDI
jgi:hypothetical protein